MALFKIFRGNRGQLDNVEKVDGHAYFCKDDGTFWIDYKEGDAIIRKQLNYVTPTGDQEIGGIKTFTDNKIVVGKVSESGTTEYGVVGVTSNANVGTFSISAPRAVQIQDTLADTNGAMRFKQDSIRSQDEYGLNGTALQFSSNPTEDAVINVPNKSGTLTLKEDVPDLIKQTKIDENQLVLGTKTSAASMFIEPLINRLVDIDPSKITVECYRADEGIWYDYFEDGSLSEAQKNTILKNLPVNGYDITVGGASRRGSVLGEDGAYHLKGKIGDKLRITIDFDNSNIYFRTNALYTKVSQNNFTADFTVEVSKSVNDIRNANPGKTEDELYEIADNSWRLVINKEPVLGWSGTNSYIFDQILGGKNSWRSRKLRVTYTINGTTGTPASASEGGFLVYGLGVFSSTYWSAASRMGRDGKPYYYDVINKIPVFENSLHCRDSNGWTTYESNSMVYSNNRLLYPAKSGTFALTSDLNDYTTLKTEQTISASKTFTAPILLPNSPMTPDKAHIKDKYAVRKVAKGEYDLIDGSTTVVEEMTGNTVKVSDGNLFNVNDFTPISSTGNYTTEKVDDWTLNVSGHMPQGMDYARITKDVDITKKLKNSTIYTVSQTYVNPDIVNISAPYLSIIGYYNQQQDDGSIKEVGENVIIMNGKDKLSFTAKIGNNYSSSNKEYVKYVATVMFSQYKADNFNYTISFGIKEGTEAPSFALKHANPTVIVTTGHNLLNTLGTTSTNNLKYIFTEGGVKNSRVLPNAEDYFYYTDVQYPAGWYKFSCAEKSSESSFRILIKSDSEPTNGTWNDYYQGYYIDSNYISFHVDAPWYFGIAFTGNENTLEYYDMMLEFVDDKIDPTKNLVNMADMILGKGPRWEDDNSKATTSVLIPADPYPPYKIYINKIPEKIDYVEVNYYTNMSWNSIVGSWRAEEAGFHYFNLPSVGYIKYISLTVYAKSGHTITQKDLEGFEPVISKVYEPYAAKEVYRLPDGFELGKWDNFNPQTGEITRKTENVVFTGDEDWIIANGYISLENMSIAEDSIVGLCNYYKYAYDYVNYTLFVQGPYVRLGTALTSYFGTVENWKNHLKALYAAGTPVTISYRRVTPIIEKVPNCPKSYVVQNSTLEILQSTNVQDGAIPTITQSYEINENLSEAANKGYVNYGLAKKLDKTGGTITGNLIVEGKTDTELGALISRRGDDVYGLAFDGEAYKLGKGNVDDHGEFKFNENEGLPIALRDDSNFLEDEEVLIWNSKRKALTGSRYKLSEILSVNYYHNPIYGSGLLLAKGFGTPDLYIPGATSERMGASRMYTEGDTLYIYTH